MCTQAREVALLEVQVLSEGAAAREAALAAEAAQAKSELQSALTEAAIANKKLAVVMQVGHRPGQLTTRTPNKSAWAALLE